MPADLAEDPGLIPSNYRQLTSTWDFSSRESDVLFWLHGYTNDRLTNTHKYKHEINLQTSRFHLTSKVHLKLESVGTVPSSWGPCARGQYEFRTMWQLSRVTSPSMGVKSLAALGPTCWHLCDSHSWKRPPAASTMEGRGI